MPIYEYQCPACKATFEELVRSERAARKVVCPQCGHGDVVRQPSVFATHTAPTRRAGPAGGCGGCCSADGSCPMAE